MKYHRSHVYKRKNGEPSEHGQRATRVQARSTFPRYLDEAVFSALPFPSFRFFSLLVYPEVILETADGGYEIKEITIAARLECTSFSVFVLHGFTARLPVPLSGRRRSTVIEVTSCQNDACRSTFRRSSQKFIVASS